MKGNWTCYMLAWLLVRIPNWHYRGSTSPRSVGEVALIWDTISHYSPVLIAPLANFIAPAQSRRQAAMSLTLQCERNPL